MFNQHDDDDSLCTKLTIMIAQLAKYNNEQLVAAANCFLTDYQSQRLARECSRSMVLAAVLTFSALSEADYDSLTAEVPQSDLVQTAILRSMITAEQVPVVQGQQVENFLSSGLLSGIMIGYDTPVLGNPSHALFEESVISEQMLLSQLQLLFGDAEA